jgi:peptidyl-prolyl cis-trans isomerase A (cyclophilin A)
MNVMKWLLAFAVAAFAANAAFAAPNDGPKVLMETSLGNITLQLDPAHAPATVDNFLRYVRDGHYDGTVVYRVVPGFVIQMGSYDADVNARPTRDPVVLEANNGLSNVRGTVAMARESDPNTATAEFFINLADNSNLDHHADDPGNATGYTVFAKVVAGMDVVDRISAVKLGDHGPMPHAAPVDPVTIRKVTVLP